MMDFTNYGLLTPNRALSLFHLLSQTIHAGVPGDVCEFGCYQGKTAAFIQRTLDLHRCPKALHLYDSFQGLPERSLRDYTLPDLGALKASEQEVRGTFREQGLTQPSITINLFAEINPRYIPGKISFVHADGDLYSSTWAILRLVQDRLSPGAIVLLDDCGEPDFPGVLTAFNEWNVGRGMTLIQLGNTDPFTHSAYFVKDAA